VLFTQGLDGKAHKRNTQATCSIACDGERVFALFMNAGAIHLIALNPDGTELWRKELGKYTSHWGYSASPILHGNIHPRRGRSRGMGASSRRSLVPRAKSCGRRPARSLPITRRRLSDGSRGRTRC